MDDDSCSKFIGSLTKYLQSLCHSYVDFESGVELVGHIYLNVDTGKKIDYVLNESVCKNGANVVKFTSNSYHAGPVDKQKKEASTPKKTTPEQSKTPEKEKEKEKKKNDDDDVLIVGSEPSRRVRQGQGGSGSRPPVVGVNQLRAQQRPMQPQGPGVFRHPRGPQPRMGMPRAGAYRQPYQPVMRGRPPLRAPASYPGPPPPGYNPAASAAVGRMDPMQANNPYASLQVRPPQTQPQGRRPSDPPVDRDVTFMREEYTHPPAGSQQPGRAPNQPGQPVPVSVAPGQPGGPHLPAPPPLQPQPSTETSTLDAMNQRFGYNQQPPTSQYLQSQQQQQHQQQLQHQQPPQQFLGPPPLVPHSQASHMGQGPVVSSVGQNLGLGVPGPQQSVPGHQVPNSSAQHVNMSQHQTVVSTHGPHPQSTAPPSFLQSQPPVHTSASSEMHQSHVSASGEMHLPVTTHTIFDANPPVSSPASAAPGSNLLTNRLLPGEAGAPGSTTTPPSSTVSHSSVPQSQSQPPSLPNSQAPGIPVSTPPASMWNEAPPPSQSGQGQPSIGNAPGVPPPAHSSHSHSQPGNPLSSPGPHERSGYSNPAPHTSESVGNIFDIFSSQQQQPQGGSQPQLPQLPQQNVPNFVQNTGSSGTHAQLSGEGSGARPQENDFFSQLLGGNSAQSNSEPPQPVSMYQAQAPTGVAPGNQPPSMSPLPATGATSQTEVKVDPGQIGVAIATAVIQEATEAAANELPETFLAPHGMEGQLPKIKSTSSTPTHDTPSPVGTHLPGSETHFLDHIKTEAGSGPQQQTSDYESGWDSGSASADKNSSPAHTTLRPLSISLVPVDSGKNAEHLKQSAAPQGQGDGEWIRDMSAVDSDDESAGSYVEPEEDNVDDDPSYNPGRNYQQRHKDTTSGHKRPRGRPPGKGKKRKTDREDSASGPPEEGSQEDQPPMDMDMTAEVHQAPGFSPSIETDNAESGDSYYKPGTFILVNTSKDREKSTRTRTTHTPAEVISTPTGQPEGLWVHLLVACSNGLWRLPNVDSLVDLCVEPADVVRTLEKASVRIVGNKVYYKFDDL